MWWWDGLARTYASLGRYEDAVAALRRGMELQEDGTKNVSQTLNLASLQVEFGHRAEALKTLDGFDPRKSTINPYGMMVLTRTRGCARFGNGDIAGARIDRDYAVAHERDSPENLTDLLLCMGDVDAAAAEMIRRLDDPEQRVDALLNLSDYDPETHPVPIDLPGAKMAAVKGRPDVKAAIARAGGVRRFFLQKGAI
jgi:hypothetical protein